MIIIEAMTRLPAPLKPSDLHKLGEELARMLRMRSAREVSLSFVTENKIQHLNKTYRQINKVTDVLSFEPDSSAQKAGKEGKAFLGDIVICVPYAKREAARRAMSLREELLRLISHGILHVSGYDHATDKEEEEMFGLQERVVDKIMSV